MDFEHLYYYIIKNSYTWDFGCLILWFLIICLHFEINRNSAIFWIQTEGWLQEKIELQKKITHYRQVYIEIIQQFNELQ